MSTVQVCFRCSEDFRAELKIEAARRRTTVDELMNTAIRNHLTSSATPSTLAPEEQRLLDAWRNASPDGKRRILGVVYKADEPVDVSLELKEVTPAPKARKTQQPQRKNAGG